MIARAETERRLPQQLRIRAQPRNLCLCKTAWWGWEDSNFQPNDYQPLALSIEQQPFVFVATMALIFIFNRSWLVGPKCRS
jgi:hypothetical protein